MPIKTLSAGISMISTSTSIEGIVDEWKISIRLKDYVSIAFVSLL